ncbi:hypothetical protein [Streptomyces sp. NRRL S-350]|uniref:hypothetical protein n=1 Tax=Streptomyces sp. NRRL S-350 TaxID=1463902 RepID=UPI00131C28CB|nr:hypothetical protein [Streptomyces sp. NRRL S-350]
MNLASWQARSASAAAADEAVSQAREHWTRVLTTAGLSWSAPSSVSQVVTVVAEELERLVGGLHAIREGGGPLGLPPNPDAGLDLTGALAVLELLKDLEDVAKAR